MAEARSRGHRPRLSVVLEWLGGRASWYRSVKADASFAGGATPGSALGNILQEPAADRGRRGPLPRDIDPWQEHVVLTVARACPWFGYKKITVICRERLDEPIPKRIVYRVMKRHGLLHRLKERLAARLAQDAVKLSQLLPKAPNELWQTDVTYVPIPGYGWWYAMTVIDYYSRYLLALRLVSSYSAAQAVLTMQEAVRQATAIHGPLTRPVFLVTDNGCSFIAQRFAQALKGITIGATGLSALAHVRIGYRMPTQLGLLERFHGTLKREEVYWNLYADPVEAAAKLALFQERYNEARPHWALKAAEPTADQPRVLTPREVYVKGQKVNPPSWSRWVGWLERPEPNQPVNGKDQESNQAEQAPSKTADLVST